MANDDNAVNDEKGVVVAAPTELQQETAEKAVNNGVLAANASIVENTDTAQEDTPGALVAGSDMHKQLSASLPPKDRNKAYDKMRQVAANTDGNFTLEDAKTHKKVTLPVEQAITLIKERNAQGVPMYVNNAGENGRFLFQPTGTVQKVEKSPEEDNEKKGGIVDWLKRNWYIVLGALAAVGVGLYFLLRKKKDKTAPMSAGSSAEKTPVGNVPDLRPEDFACNEHDDKDTTWPMPEIEHPDSIRDALMGSGNTVDSSSGAGETVQADTLSQGR